ncbi:hypothetical protein GCM10010381_60560 [Streptomyces xantholiticus]|nr:hypothetical protein GCM10010381_60560 [Streptomyces xantholiticus]
MLVARSCHASVRSLERYARLGVDAVARRVAERDPAARRRRCTKSRQSAWELLGLPGDDPHQLVLLDTGHSHPHRVHTYSPPLLTVALQLFFDGPNGGFSLDQAFSIPYGPLSRPELAV